jgi:hypothetical protein
MTKLRELLFASAALAFAHIAVAQGAGNAPAPAGGPASTSAADVSAPVQTSTDPLVQKRIADKAAKDEYKMRKKIARQEKKAAKADMKAEKREARRERNERLANEPKASAPPSGQ